MSLLGASLVSGVAAELAELVAALLEPLCALLGVAAELVVVSLAELAALLPAALLVTLAELLWLPAWLAPEVAAVLVCACAELAGVVALLPVTFEFTTAVSLSAIVSPFIT